jgi:hypothetical protein
MIPVGVTVGAVMTLLGLMIAIAKLRNRRRDRLWASGDYSGPRRRIYGTPLWAGGAGFIGGSAFLGSGGDGGGDGGGCGGGCGGGGCGGG